MMPEDPAPSERPEHLSETPHLAEALESDRFKQFLDHMPFAVAVSELGPAEAIMYANIGFEHLIGQPAGAVLGQTWDILPGMAVGAADRKSLSDAILAEEDYLGVFKIDGAAEGISVDAWSNVILNEAGSPTYRLVALADIGNRTTTDQEKARPADPGEGRSSSRAAAPREEQSPDDHRPHPARGAQPARQPGEGTV